MADDSEYVYDESTGEWRPASAMRENIQNAQDVSKNTKIKMHILLI
jgi:hypothetical protein